VSQEEAGATGRGHDGVSITGGNVSIGALAQGANARANVTVPAGDGWAARDRNEIAALLAELRATLARQQAQLSDPARLRAAEELAGELAGELEQAEPSPSRVRRVLAGVLEAAGTVTAVSAAAGALREALPPLG
jgi:hypothetical protein